MRSSDLLMGLSLLVAGCTDEKASDEDDSPGSLFEDDTAEPTESDSACPPEVPEEYQYLWDCEANSCDGSLVYHRGVGSSTADGGFSVTEQWFVFDGNSSCIDTFEIVGSASDYNPSNFNCSNCEEIFEIHWNLVESQCNWNWSSTFADQESEEQSYYGFLMFDTHNAFGDRNPDDAVLVLGAPVNGGSYAPFGDYGRGTAVPVGDGVDINGDGGTDFYPADLEWANSGSCYQ
jgi:hypothetical protein